MKGQLEVTASRLDAFVTCNQPGCTASCHLEKFDNAPFHDKLNARGWYRLPGGWYRNKHGKGK